MYLYKVAWKAVTSPRWRVFLTYDKDQALTSALRIVNTRRYGEKIAWDIPRSPIIAGCVSDCPVM